MKQVLGHTMICELGLFVEHSNDTIYKSPLIICAGFYNLATHMRLCHEGIAQLAFDKSN